MLTGDISPDLNFSTEPPSLSNCGNRCLDVRSISCFSCTDSPFKLSCSSHRCCLLTGCQLLRCRGKTTLMEEHGTHTVSSINLNSRLNRKIVEISRFTSRLQAWIWKLDICAEIMKNNDSSSRLDTLAPLVAKLCHLCKWLAVLKNLYFFVNIVLKENRVMGWKPAFHTNSDL